MSHIAPSQNQIPIRPQTHAKYREQANGDIGRWSILSRRKFSNVPLVSLQQERRSQTLSPTDEVCPDAKMHKWDGGSQFGQLVSGKGRIRLKRKQTKKEQARFLSVGGCRTASGRSVFQMHSNILFACSLWDLRWKKFIKVWRKFVKEV